MIVDIYEFEENIPDTVYNCYLLFISTIGEEMKRLILSLMLLLASVILYDSRYGDYSLHESDYDDTGWVFP